MTVSSKTRLRIITLMAVLSAAILILVAQMFRWQVFERQGLLAYAEREHQGREATFIRPRRGAIYDHKGFLLATDTVTYDVSASPRSMREKDRLEAADRLSSLLGKDRDQLVDVMDGNAGWIPLATDLPQSQGEAIGEMDINGITVQAFPFRVYPAGSLAAHVLGFVNSHKAGFEGHYGVERYYHVVLRGLAGEQRAERDPEGDALPVGPGQYTPPSDGRDLYLTIERTAQYIVEGELKRAVDESGAESGTVVVIQPRTGAILAMAGWPTYDPNHFAEVFETDPRLFSNPVISEQYEPGSVFKVVTLAAGIESGVITPDSTIYDSGAIEVGGRTIYNWDRQPHGTVDMTTVLGKSLNVGSAQIAVMMGSERFYSYVQRFGFGSLCGVDIYGERPGVLKTPGDPDWYESDLGTNSFGQGVAVTPLQMTVAVAAIANDGLLMRPYVVQQIVERDDAHWIDPREVHRMAEDDHIRWMQPQAVRQVVSVETARTLTRMMTAAVDEETTLAQVSGYRVAGKSGTAEIPVPGGYHPTHTIASFVGYLPADDPAFVILVVINKPQTSPWGGQVAAPAFARIAQQLVILFDVPPDHVRREIVANQQVSPAVH